MNTISQVFTAIGFLIIAGIVTTTRMRVDTIEEKVDARNNLTSGKANYLPGAACVIATSAEQTPADIINYARACGKAHETWLETLKENEE
jgi:hypothetical protein|tara:strand:+ start:9134 stop:9403 length:270 start_codon:yes stop_codon:yes gene_type:complete